MCNVSGNIIDCCSKPDYPGTVKMIEDCGFKIPTWIIFAILDGQCTSVTIGPSNDCGVPFVDVEQRGCKKQRFLHPGREVAKNFVFDILNPGWKEKKEQEIEEWMEKIPEFIRPNDGMI